MWPDPHKLGAAEMLVLLAFPYPGLLSVAAAMGKCVSSAVGQLGWEFPVCFASCYSNVTGKASSGNPFALAKRAVLGWDRTSLRDGGYPAAIQSRSQGRLAQHGNHHLVLRQS